MKPASTVWLNESNCVGDEEVTPQPRFHDTNTGVLILRLTSQPCINTNIYPEHPASTPDGRRFIFARVAPLGGHVTYWIADVPTHRIRQITDEPEAKAPVVSPDGSWLYYSVGPAIWRMSPETFEREQCYEMPASLGSTGGIRTVSARGQRFLTTAHPGPGRYAVAMVDLEQQSARLIYEELDMRNAHEQYSRTASRKVLLQVNDGIETDAHGNIVKLVGANGASLHVVDDDGTSHLKLPVGSSPCERVQGHQCWVGGTDLVITALHRRNSPTDLWIQDRLVVIAPGESSYRVVGEGRGFTHVHTSPDGRWWVADCNRTADIYVGSIRTGRYRRFCHSGSTFGAPQYTHPHPFFLGDGRTIGWNSDVSGVPHVYVGVIPQDFLEALG